MTYTLKLYIAGMTACVEHMLNNLRRLCEEKLGGAYELVVIDVVENPQLAEDEKILATPTLVRETPLPQRRIVGDISNEDLIATGLDFLTVDCGRGEGRSKKSGKRGACFS